jgi:PHD/YefM family antitoxin component YafN of YafNO toxin-antitoxin module
MTVKGVQFVTDTDGRKVAVLLDLEEWGELWEDIYDNMLADERSGEDSMPLKEFEAELRALHGHCQTPQ